jgi:TatD DNase family protein
LEIAQSHDLPVVFHSVGRYYDLYKLIKSNFPKTRGILHSFASSDEVFQIFKSMGFCFSLGASILVSRNHDKVLQNVLDWGLYVIETDAPAQKPFFAETEFNKLKYLPQIAEKIAEIGNIDLSILRNNTWKNLKELGFPSIEIPK